MKTNLIKNDNNDKEYLEETKTIISKYSKEELEMERDNYENEIAILQERVDELKDKLKLFK